MSWAKFDDMLPSNRKWRRLVKRSPEAACLWVAAICYSARYLTDGVISKAEIEEVAPLRQPEKLAALLVEETMFEDIGDAWVVHDYLDHNPPAAAILAKREEDRERKAKAREKGSKRSSRGGDGRFGPPGQTADVQPDNPPDGAAPSERSPSGQPTGQTADVRAESAPPSERRPSGVREAVPATRPVPSRPDQSQLPGAVPAQRGGDPPGDALWEALLAACGVEAADVTDASRGAYAKAAADLRRCGATPDEVPHRAAAYRLRWPDASLTPTALARRWPECSNGAALQPAPTKGQAALIRAQARGGS